jgi:hypothetical protein
MMRVARFFIEPTPPRDDAFLVAWEEAAAQRV